MVLSLNTAACAHAVKTDAMNLDPIAAQIAHGGSVRVIVLLDVPFAPEGTLTAAAAAQQLQAIGAAQDAFVKDVLKGSTSTVLNRFAWMPALVLEIDAATLKRIRHAKHVKAVDVDRRVQPMAPAAVPGSPQ